MASRKGMNLRIDAAQRRADAALEQIEKAGTVAIPARPGRVRDANLAAAQQAEWTADVLEAVAAQAKTEAPKRTTRRKPEAE